uniref:uncharacterized protein LOC108950658 n=1 Tax=Ciona intestinalis TaxID=7719 RepID=UPI00089DAC0E|nr:uncharacterized protein LOC108950658 [Ciona intestinalis]XP_026695435.1 uncharacterized protein LOC108950658 [Ciona intestinalis]|eukprot:XP_018672232.1 uncharacterized protein LOC108950658 [Ciona intestinalis]
MYIMCVLTVCDDIGFTTCSECTNKSSAPTATACPGTSTQDTNVFQINETALVRETQPDMTDSTVPEEVDLPTFKTIFATNENDLNEWQRMFLDQQRKNAAVTPTGHRFHPDLVRWAIELFTKSPAAYLHLQKSGVLSLPSRGTISAYRNIISPSPGLNKKALEEMDRVTKQTSHLAAYITMDEMKIKENLVIRNGKLVGFIDFGDQLVSW